jgi:hypothetical protein
MRASWFVLLAACSSPARAPSTPTNSATGTSPAGPPTLAHLRELLAPHAGLRFDQAAVDDRACSVTPTLGEYVDLLVRYGEHGESPGDKHSLKGGCSDRFEQQRGLDPPSSPEYWMCIIDSYVVDPAGESPWHYELRLRVRKSDEAVDLTTLACPGT